MMTLAQIRDDYNRLVPLAQARGISVELWVRIPPTRDRGLMRLNWLRAQLGMEPAEIMQAAPGATLPLRAIYNEWNSLVPQARAQGIDVNAWVRLPPTARRGMQRLAWLRQQLGQTTVPLTVVPAAAPIADLFDFTTFGVEIECMMPHGMSAADLARYVTDAGVDCRQEVYNHNNERTWWKIVSDGSLGDYIHGVELVAPKLRGQNGFDQVKKVCDVLVAKRIKINNRCGLHVHIDVGNESVSTINNLCHIYSHFRNTIHSFLADSRTPGGQGYFYAQNPPLSRTPNSYRTMNDLIRGMGQEPDPRYIRNSDRYRCINLKPFNVYRTVEFRQHQGSIEYVKISNWVKLCMRMLLAGRNGYNATAADSLEALAQVTGMTSEEHEYFATRTAHFIARRARQNTRRRAA